LIILQDYWILPYTICTIIRQRSYNLLFGIGYKGIFKVVCVHLSGVVFFAVRFVFLIGGVLRFRTIGIFLHIPERQRFHRLPVTCIQVPILYPSFAIDQEIAFPSVGK